MHADQFLLNNILPYKDNIVYSAVFRLILGIGLKYTGNYNGNYIVLKYTGNYSGLKYTGNFET